MVADAGTFAMASFIRLMPWRGGCKPRLGWNDGQRGLSLFPCGPRAVPSPHGLFVSLHEVSPAASHFLRGSSGLPKVHKWEISGLPKPLEAQNCHRALYAG